jgi:hypothetical protein
MSRSVERDGSPRFVGVDGSEESLGALRWALGEACRRARDAQLLMLGARGRVGSRACCCDQWLTDACTTAWGRW